MNMTVAKRRKHESIEANPASETLQSLVGRQPILDRAGLVQGYELLFRPNVADAERPFDGNRATASVVLNTLTQLGLDQVVGPHRAYINFTADLLVNDTALMLPKERTVIEILETVVVDKALVVAVQDLVKRGYEIALDDFVYDAHWEPLLDLASIVKIDVLALDEKQIEAQLKRLRQWPVQLLAEKVESVEQHDSLIKMGFDLFQGYYYAKPNIVASAQIPDNHTSVMRLLAALNSSTNSMAEIESLVSDDVALSYRLLKYLNSAFFALPKKVDSVQRAIVFFGIDMLRRWATLLVMSSVDGKPKILTQNALVRARFCEELARRNGKSECDGYFTVGLFSVLDVLLDAPMALIVESLPVSPEIVAALVSQRGDHGAALRCVCAYEQCRWEDVKYGELDSGTIGEAYLSSIEWAFDAAAGL